MVSEYWRAVIKSRVGIALVLMGLEVIALFKDKDWMLALLVAAILGVWGAIWVTAYWTYIAKK
ncbi:MAG: hypothetical protein ACYDHY_05995 [Acidiferrobacterales bacterium]